MSRPPEEPTVLADILDQLDSTLIDVVVAPSGLEVPVAEARIHDRLGEVVATAGDLMLGVGLDSHDPEAIEVVVEAGKVGASAVVIKMAALTSPSLARAAEDAGIVLLSVPPATDWGQLLTVLRIARGASREAAGAKVRIGDLFGLANAIAALAGGATTIEDMDSTVLAFSNLGHPVDKPRQDTILGRRVPQGWSQALVDRGVFRELYGSDDVVRVEDLTPPGSGSGNEKVELRPRLAIAVRAGGEALGSIWVQEGAQPLSDNIEDALRAAAPIAALHLLQHRASADIERRRVAERVQALLSGEGAGGQLRALQALRPGTVMVVLAIEPLLEQDEDAPMVIERTLGLVRVQIEVFWRHAYAVALDGVVYVVIAAPDVRDTARLEEIVEELRARTARAAGRGIRAATGGVVQHTRELYRSRTEADEVLRILDDRGHWVGQVENLRGAIALRRVEEMIAENEGLLDGKASLLWEHDRLRGTEYCATLLAYLDHFGDVVRAAESISIHRNTLHYRLARLVEISGLDLKDPGERLIAHLQLRSPAARPDSEGHLVRPHNRSP